MENNSQPKYKTTNNKDIIDIRAILVKYLKKWYWFVISICICVVMAFVYLKITLPQYSVQTTILLRDDQTSNPLSQLALLEGLTGSGASKEVEDEIQILTTKTITTQVIKSLNVETEYYVKKSIKPYVELYPVSPIKLLLPAHFNDTLSTVLVFDIKQTKKGYEIKFRGGLFEKKYLLDNISSPFNTPYGEMSFESIAPLGKNTKYKVITYPIRVLTESYSSAIKVAPVNKKSNAIIASTISVVPAKAKVILDELIDLYNEDVINDKNTIGNNTAYFVNEQIALIEEELTVIEAEVEKYKKLNNLTDISSEAALFLTSISEYDKKLAEIQTQINLVQYIGDYVREEENKYTMIPANLGIEDKSLAVLIKEYNDVLLEHMKLLRTTNEKNPVISQLEELLSVLRSSIITSIKSISDGLNIAKKDLLLKDSQFSAKIKDIPTKEREFIELKRRQEVTQALYLYLLQKKKENELSLATTTSQAKLLDPAYVSLLPVSPKRMIVLFIALIVGCMIPITIIYLLDLLNNKIQSKKEYQRLVHAPFIGSIGVNKTSEIVVVKSGRTTPIIEMFRLLRTNLQFMISGKKNPVILVTSTVSGEGKSFISVNLSLSLALMKKKVVLLGMDIRNPMLSEYLKISKDDKGITMFLADSDVKLQDILFESPINPNLYIIQGGIVPPNPTELLMSARLDEMIADLKKHFDYIIIDSAPVGVVSDTYQINRVVDNTVFVSRQNYTSRELTTFINDIYDNNRLNNMSVALNGTNDVEIYYEYNHKKYLKEK